MTENVLLILGCENQGIPLVVKRLMDDVRMVMKPRFALDRMMGGIAAQDGKQLTSLVNLDCYANCAT
jgi:hypothetical protein